MNEQIPKSQLLDADCNIEEAYGLRQKIGLIIGLALLLFTFVSPPLFGLTPDASKVALLSLTMAWFWVTEALPIPATALFPLVLLPTLGVYEGRKAIQQAAAPYADPIIYLFMGGFILSLALERWNLHRRIALNIIGLVGSKPRALIFGFLIAATFLSMWVSNSATAMMLLPIGIAVYKMLPQTEPKSSREFGAAIVLTIAYGANIGGMGTLIGTPPNAILKGYIEKTYPHLEVSFAQWLFFGIPLILITLPFVYFILTRLSFKVSNEKVPGVEESIHDEIKKLGPMTKPEYMVATMFLIAVVLWISREFWKASFPAITDEVIAMGCAMALFFLPVDFSKGIYIMDWKAMKKFPWEVLVLFGGGLSLAAAFEKSNLAQAMAGLLNGMQNWPALGMVFLMVSIMIVATALTSNTATTAAFLPVIGALAVGIDQPVLLLAVPVAVAASADFMLPVGTPPNAIAYGSGLVTLPRMVKAGVWMNLLFALLIPLLMWTFGRWAFRI